MKVLVTGASRGIGRGIAQALIARGDQVAVTARDADALTSLNAAATLPADLLDADAVAGLIDAAHGALGGLDGLVNNAGTIDRAPVGEITPEALQSQMQVDFSAPFMLAQAAAARMRSGGTIVNVASDLALRPAPGTAAYAAAKAALLSMTRAFALELGADDIRVNAVAPGPVDTGMLRASGDGIVESLRAAHPLGRMTTVQDIAHGVLYLLDAPYVTGTVLCIDGGMSLAG